MVRNFLHIKAMIATAVIVLAIILLFNWLRPTQVTAFNGQKTELCTFPVVER
jgi:hypothetical protein